VCVSGALAHASEQSTRLYSHGLVEFHLGRYPDALKLFDQAVAADPDDSYARYYRAVTRGRLHDLDGAISDLRAALAAKPDFDQAALELGVALVQTGALREAIPLLQQAQRDPDADAHASLFLGLAQLRLNQLPEARKNFQRAAKDPQQELAVTYYEGVLDYREGNLSGAEEHFAAVVRSGGDSEIRHEAELFLKTIHESAPAAVQLSGAVGFQYDSNVVLAPGSDVINAAAGISNQADGRATLAVSGAYELWRHKQTQLSVSYDFFQSLHFRLTDYNLQDNGPSIQLASSVGPVQFGVLGRYDYYLLSTDSFLQEGTALPWVTVVEPRGRTELFYRMRRRDFIKQAYWVRDAFNHSTGIRQFVYLDTPERYLSLAYRFDHEDPVNTRPSLNANQYRYDGHEVGASVGWTFPCQLSGELTYLYRHENYAPESDGRHDNQHQVIVLARRPIGPYLTAVAGYYGTINHSNNDLGDRRFDYERHIGSLALEARF
jgi:tetratricopeptide (TPR) repeat protein